MDLYHFSFVKYSPGQIISLSEESNYHKSLVDRGMGWVNDLLDEYRVLGQPSRKTAVFGVDTVPKAFGIRDLYPMSRNSTFHIYQIEMENPVAAPMRLCGLVEELGKNHFASEHIAKEYWNMTESWNFLEYMSNRFEVKKEMTDFIRTSINLDLVQRDLELARRKFTL